MPMMRRCSAGYVQHYALTCPMRIREGACLLSLGIAYLAFENRQSEGARPAD
jgi:hypothetical protein